MGVYDENNNKKKKYDDTRSPCGRMHTYLPYHSVYT